MEILGVTQRWNGNGERGEGGGREKAPIIKACFLVRSKTFFISPAPPIARASPLTSLSLRPRPPAFLSVRDRSRNERNSLFESFGWRKCWQISERGASAAAGKRNQWWKENAELPRRFNQSPSRSLFPSSPLSLSLSLLLFLLVLLSIASHVFRSHLFVSPMSGFRFLFVGEVPFTSHLLSIYPTDRGAGGGWARYLSENTATIVCIVSLNLMRRDRQQNRRLRRVRERVRTVGSVSLRGWRGHFAWATVNQLRAVMELLGECETGQKIMLRLLSRHSYFSITIECDL